jgi:4-aminobutyrate aminotransferase/(S)-3-amino-2-methylpropionate transaminase
MLNGQLKRFSFYTNIFKFFTLEENMSQKTKEQLTDLRSQFISNGVGHVSMNFIESGQGAILRDVAGKEYIDFAGGIGTMNVGHSHPKVVEAIKRQAEKLTHTCFMVNPYEPAVKLAEKLCRVTPGNFAKKAVFLNCGSEAVENAVKIARYYTKRPAIVVFENAYHGRTLLTMTMTSKIKPYKFGFGPFAPEIYRMPFGDVMGSDKLNDFFIKHVNPEAVAVKAVLLHRRRATFRNWRKYAATTVSYSWRMKFKAAWEEPARCLP